MKKAIVSVTNDLYSDRRVDRTCKVLLDCGYEVLLVGRKQKNSKSLTSKNYQCKRMRLFFSKGPFFYAEYNIRLFFFLLFNKASLLFSNDLDTLPANYFAGKFKKSKLIYDSHEFYTETAPLNGRNVVKKIWERIEKLIFPKLDNVITVSQSIADAYENKYGVAGHIIKNIPKQTKTKFQLSKDDLGLPADKKIVLMQGGGINREQGAEESLLAMKYVDNAVLVFIGAGDIIKDLKPMVKENCLENKVFFIPRVSYQKIAAYTKLADLGLLLIKDSCLSYRYSLPNKLFEYIYAEVPVLANPLIEIKRVIGSYPVGLFIDNYEPKHIAEKIKQALSDEKRHKSWKANTKLLMKEYDWKMEEKKLKMIITNIDKKEASD